MEDDFLNLIRTRRSIRSFQPDRLLRAGQIETLLDAAHWAPNGGNVQPWRFIAVREANLMKDLADAAFGQHFLAEASAIIAVCADLESAEASYGERGRNLYCIQDTAAAIQNILLCAHAMGLGACWVGAFDEEKVARLLKVESGLRPVALLPVGIPAENPSPRSRRALSEIVEYRD